MSLNWVMRKDVDLNSTSFVLLSGETVIYTFPQNIQTELTPVGQEKPETLSINRAQIYITSQRIVILSLTQIQEGDNDLPVIDNFSLLYQDIKTYKLDMPWFGSNKFKILFKVSNPNSGLNYLYPWNLTLHFMEGGAIDFNKNFTEVITRFNNNQIDELPLYSSLIDN